MPRVTATVKIKYNKLGKMKAKLPVETSRALRRAGLEVMREARRNCPVDSGTLKGSIAIEGGQVGSLDVIVYTNSGYGAHVNFGTRFQSAQPFMTNAAEYGARILKKELDGLVNRL